MKGILSTSFFSLIRVMSNVREICSVMVWHLVIQFCHLQINSQVSPFRLDGDHPFILYRLFAVTHLDHLDEDDRLKQIKDFNPPKDNIDILMGDMNALTREDYLKVYYQNAIVEVRAKSLWENRLLI